MQKLTQPWILSFPAKVIFQASSWVALSLFVLVVAASTTTLDQAVFFGDSPSVKFFSLAIFGLFGAAVLSQFVLWFSMMWFCIRYDDRKFPARAVSLIAQLFGLSLASAIIYFVAYSAQYKRTLSDKELSTPGAPGLNN